MFGSAVVLGRGDVELRVVGRDEYEVAEREARGLERLRDREAEGGDRVRPYRAENGGVERGAGVSVLELAVEVCDELDLVIERRLRGRVEFVDLVVDGDAFRGAELGVGARHALGHGLVGHCLRGSASCTVK